MCLDMNTQLDDCREGRGARTLVWQAVHKCCACLQFMTLHLCSHEERFQALYGHSQCYILGTTIVIDPLSIVEGAGAVRDYRYVYSFPNLACTIGYRDGDQECQPRRHI